MIVSTVLKQSPKIQTFLVMALEFLDEVVDETFDFENTLLDGEKGDIKSSSTKIEDQLQSRRCVRQQPSCRESRP
jgi:hypothetical protein